MAVKFFLPVLIASSLALVMRLNAAVRAITPEDGAQYFFIYVQPVLESTCVRCHDKDDQKGGGRLDTLEHMLKGGKSGSWLVPGKADESKLYLSTQLPAMDPLVMPPGDEPPLTPPQAAHLKAWINAGAKWPADSTLTVKPRQQFVRDIQPILEVYCISCHRPGKMKGDLDLTTLETARKGGKNNRDLIPYDIGATLMHRPIKRTEDGTGFYPNPPVSSWLLRKIMLPEDHDGLMPPLKSGGPLSKAMQEKLRLWVSSGAPWPEGVVLVPRPKPVERLPSPDNIELTATIRENIPATSKESKEHEMATYTGTVAKNGKSFKMVPIPSGEFLMGSPETEEDRKPDEGPQIKVKIEPFWMGATEVTWDLYMPFMATPDARWKDGTKKALNPAALPADTVSSPTAPYTDMTFGMGQEGFPAISMTEHAANKFCQWLSAQTGHFYRLPTEAEWEYAARAGTTTTWSFGDDVSKLGEYAWYLQNSDEKPHPVGQKKPNPWGLFDMHGNVTEWTLDQYDPIFYAKLAAMIDPGPTLPPWNQPALPPWNKPTTLYPRTVRGGSWDDDPRDLRSAARRGSSKDWKRMDPGLPKSLWYHTNAQFLGMRIVRPLHIPSLEAMHDAWNLGTWQRPIVRVMGEVRDPGKNVRFREGMTLMGAINGASSFSEFSDTTRVKLLRGLTETTYDMRKIHADGSNNPLLQNGDQIFVPRRN